MTLSPAKAWDLQSEVIAQVAGQRASWIMLASRLAEFHAGAGWLLLSHDSFNEWLGQPEISLGRAEAYAMIGAWRDLVVDRGVDPSRLEGLDVSKVAVILPAVRGGRDIEDALSACETLSRSDLRAEYQSPEHAEYRVCEACGSKVRVTA
jgi:hypothetical protein